MRTKAATDGKAWSVCTVCDNRFIEVSNNFSTIQYNISIYNNAHMVSRRAESDSDSALWRLTASQLRFIPETRAVARSKMARRGSKSHCSIKPVIYPRPQMSRKQRSSIVSPLSNTFILGLKPSFSANRAHRSLLFLLLD